jgi:hypothetical protein
MMVNSLSDVKINLEFSFIFASALAPVDNHAGFTIFTTCQGIDHFFCKPKTIHRPTIGKTTYDLMDDFHSQPQYFSSYINGIVKSRTGIR